MIQEEIEKVSKRFKLPDGYKLWLGHYRLYSSERGDYVADIPLGAEDTLCHNGGVTLVDVFDAEGNWITCGESICSLKDSYNKKVGRHIATGRALKKLSKLLDGEYALDFS